MQFLAHIEQFQPATVVINTIMRTVPGMLIYTACCLIMLLSIAQGFHLALRTDYPEFSSYGWTVYEILVGDFQRIYYYHEMTRDGAGTQKSFYLNACWICLVVSRYTLLFFGLALQINLYKRAMAFEKDFMPVDPDKNAFNTIVDEIHQQVGEVFKTIKNKNHVNDNKFENQKIVAWLLNRNKEAQSQERAEFFKRLNLELKNGFDMAMAIPRSPKPVPGAGGAIELEEIRLQNVDGYDKGTAPGKGHGQGSTLLTKSGEAGNQGMGGASFSDKNAPVVHPIEFEAPYWLI